MLINKLNLIVLKIYDNNKYPQKNFKKWRHYVESTVLSISTIVLRNTSLPNTLCCIFMRGQRNPPYRLGYMEIDSTRPIQSYS